MAFWDMDVVDVCVAVACLLVRQAGIRMVMIEMAMTWMRCFVFMVMMVYIVCFTLVYAQR